MLILLIWSSLLYSRLQPELIFGIVSGYYIHELRIISALSLREIISNWGFETGLALAIINIVRGFVFIMFLKHSQLLVPWQQWFALYLLLANTPGVIAQDAFWKRWSLYLGGTITLYPALFQLSLALFLALLLLTKHKKYLTWASTLAGLIISLSETLTYPELGLMLLTCLTVSFGFNFSNVMAMVNNAITHMGFTKRTSKTI